MTAMESSINDVDRLSPSLILLLKQTFRLTTDILNETPSSEKKLKLASEDVEAGEEQLPGISDNELLQDPFILLAIRRLLKILKDVFEKKVINAGDGDSLSNSKSNNGNHNPTEQLSLDHEVVENSLLELSNLTNYTWEQLNIGHWKSVPRIWRKLYTCFAILKVCFLALKQSPNIEIIRECDMGILMGESICQNILSRIAEEISLHIITAEVTTCDSDSVPTSSSTSQTVVDYERVHLKNKSTKEFDVITSKKPSLQEFLSFMNAKTPALLTNTIDHWPALKKWNVEYIQKVAGFRTVPVEVGQKYTSEDWTQKVMTINEFICKYMKVSSEGTEKNCSQDIGYVAQYHLFRQLPELGKDIRIPEYCTLGSTTADNNENIEINAWFGPANTISPTHYDPNHNILVQIFGSKIIRLFPPSESSKLKPHPESSLLFNTSQLDIEQDDLFIAHPEMRNAKHCDIILSAGKALYIPPKWWHYVKSLEPSFSVSFWFV